MKEMPNKADWRRRLRRARQDLSPTQRRQAEARICRLLRPCMRRGRRIGLYWAVGSEVRLDALLPWAERHGARLYFPHIAAGAQRLWFTPYQRRQAPQTPHGKRAPAIPQFGGRKIRAHRLHTLIVPLVGIDRRGYRLGQGGGYYDVTLAHTRPGLRPRTVGVGFACQQVAQLPAEPHDMPLDVFVCEQGWQYFRHRPNKPPPTAPKRQI